jgi:hypothetical protein
LLTDLPDAGGIMVSVDRHYRKVGSRSNYVLTYFSESSDVGEWRRPHTVTLDNDQAKADLDLARRLAANLGEPFSVESVSPDVRVGFTFHINQRPPFERGNPNLVGPHVEEGTFGRTMSTEVSVPFPFDAAGINETTWADPTGLEVGGNYVVSKPTPIMPSPNPSDPLQAIAQIVTLESGGTFAVLEVSREPSGIWYRVRVEEGAGWINSIALLGQELTER